MFNDEKHIKNLNKINRSVMKNFITKNDYQSKKYTLLRFNFCWVGENDWMKNV